MEGMDRKRGGVILPETEELQKPKQKVWRRQKMEISAASFRSDLF